MTNEEKGVYVSKFVADTVIKITEDGFSINELLQFFAACSANITLSVGRVIEGNGHKNGVTDAVKEFFDCYAESLSGNARKLGLNLTAEVVNEGQRDNIH